MVCTCLEYCPRPSPPAPEGWDKGLTQPSQSTSTSSRLHSSLAHNTCTLLLASRCHSLHSLDSLIGLIGRWYVGGDDLGVVCGPYPNPPGPGARDNNYPRQGHLLREVTITLRPRDLYHTSTQPREAANLMMITNVLNAALLACCTALHLYHPYTLRGRGEASAGQSPRQHFPPGEEEEMPG